MINRIPERQAITNIYKDYADKSALLILYAKTGVGKTLLTDTIFGNLEGSHYVRLKINQQQAEETQGFYLSGLAKALNDYANTTSSFSSIEEFAETIYSRDTNGEKAIDDLLDIAFILFNRKDLRERFNQSKAFRSELVKKALNNDNEIAVSFLLEYITHISRNRKIILSIENIQNVNPRLVTFLNELLKKTKSLFLVGEYTLSNSEFEVTTLFQQFPYDCTSIYELKKLNKVELLGGLSQIVSKESIDHIHQVIDNSYDDSSGNLANLQFLIKKNNLTRNLSQDSPLSKIRYDNALHALYETLINIHRLCLWYIISHSGRVTINALTQLYDRIAERQTLFGSIDLLCDARMVIMQGEYLCMAHDSMTELLKQEEDSKKFLIICNERWLNFYRDISIQTDFLERGESLLDKDDLLTMQINFILNIGGNSNIDWMNTILSEISRSLSASLSYSLLSKVVNVFYQVVATNENQRLIYSTFEWVTIILSKLGQWEQLAKMIESYHPSRTSDLFFLLQANARVATCDKTIKSELEAITNKTDPFIYIGSQLLLIRYYRTFNNIKKARQIWSSLQPMKNDTPYQFAIDDQINLCSLNFRKRQKFLHLSEKGHIVNGDLYQYCSTLLNINANSFYLYFSKRISKSRFLQIASANLSIVKHYLADANYPVHVYINQKTILQFVDGSIPGDVMLKNFQTAYSNCGISGNKVLIGANIVAVGLKYNMLAEVASYVEELMAMSKKYLEIGSEFAKYPLINCYNFYYRTKNRPGAKDVLRLFRKNTSLNGFSDYLLAFPYLNELALRLLKYYPCNIYNWDIDFKSIHSRFNDHIALEAI